MGEECRPFACHGPLTCRVGTGSELGFDLAGSAESSLIQCVEILADGALRLSRIDPGLIPLLLRCGVLIIGNCLDQAGINGQPLAANQTFGNTTGNRAFEQMPRQRALAETTMTVFEKVE